MEADTSEGLSLPASIDEAGKAASDRRILYEVIDQNRLAGIDAVGAALSHELNQPLTALVIYLQALQRRTAASGMTAGGQIHEIAEKALREAERATDIVRRMRRLSLRAEPERQPIDINALASETIDNALVGVPTHPVIERDFARDLPAVLGDPVQIRQVMVNLIKNAAEATQLVDVPRIAISTSRDEGMVHFTVRDNGRGIDPRIVGKLFRAFETSKANGQGLGLAISRMIAQNHGGDLVMTSAGGDQGAAFALKLPLK